MASHVETILGPINPADLGVTVTHEHLFLDLGPAWLSQPKSTIEQALARELVNIRNLWWVKRYPNHSLDNLRLSDYDEAVEEILHYKLEGGNSLVEVSSKGLYGDPKALRRVSLQTGLNIIAGTGYYINTSHPPDMDSRSIDKIAEELKADVTKGFDGTDVKAGIIGEIGIAGTMYAKEIKREGGTNSGEDYGIHRNEEKVLKASAGVHSETGIPMSIHTPRKTDREHPSSWWGLKILDILKDEGVDFGKVIICHCDRSDENIVYQKEIARRGAYVEYDMWGYDPYNALFHDQYPNDLQRIRFLKELIQGGYLRNLVVAQDICLKVMRVKYGGHGYGHILRNVVPMMIREGLTRDQIKTILVENPRNVLSF